MGMYEYTIEKIEKNTTETVTMKNGDEYVRYSEYNWGKWYGGSLEPEYSAEKELEVSYDTFIKKKQANEYIDETLVSRCHDQIFKKNLEVNGKQKLMTWLYSETLELASALVAVELSPTPEHFEEVYEEIADVKVLLDQYFIYHEIEATFKSISLEIPIHDNCQMANLFSQHGFFLKHGLNYPSAQIVLKALDALETKKYASPEIMEIYNKKIVRLDLRLNSGEFSK